MLNVCRFGQSPEMDRPRIHTVLPRMGKTAQHLLKQSLVRHDGKCARENGPGAEAGRDCLDVECQGGDQ
jgi:hypothetical protein